MSAQLALTVYILCSSTDIMSDDFGPIGNIQGVPLSFSGSPGGTHMKVVSVQVCIATIIWKQRHKQLSISVILVSFFKGRVLVYLLCLSYKQRFCQAQ